jgi:hypothetical protein
MNMQTRIYAGVTVDVTNLSDLYAAVALVEGAEVVHTAADKFSRRQRTADSRQLDRQPRRRTSAKPEMVKASTDRKSKRHSVANGDPRAVFMANGHNNTVVDVKATLRNMGLTAKQLLGMRTKQGTLEYTVKRSLVLNRAHAGRKLGEVRASLNGHVGAEREVAA